MPEQARDTASRAVRPSARALGLPAYRRAGPAGLDAALLLALQKSAGNQATRSVIARYRDETRRPIALASLLQRANGGAVVPGPGGPNPRCLQLMGEILSFLLGGAQHVIEGIVFNGPNIHRGLIERYEHMRADPRNLFRDFRNQPHPNYGSWEGHQNQYRDMARGLRDRLNEFEANGCNGPGGGLPEAARREVRRAWDYATREPPVQPAPRAEPEPVRRESIDVSKLLEILAIIGISVLLVGLVIAALLDPEPVTKLALIGVTAATAVLLLTMLGLREPEQPQIASAEPFPEREPALA